MNKETNKLIPELHFKSNNAFASQRKEKLFLNFADTLIE
jgi:hypothetical protein